MTVLEKVVLIYGGIFLGLGVILSVVNQPYFDTIYTLEDGVLEWLTVMALATVFAVTVKRLYVGFVRFSGMQRVVLVLIALLFCFGAGEEISWGQRLFQIESGAFFQKYNSQGETNLHNLMLGETKVNKLVFGKMLALIFSFYLLVLTPLYHRSDRVRLFIDAWAIPIPQRYQWIGYLVVVLTVEGVVNVLSETSKRGELTEFSAALIVMLNLLYPYNSKALEPV